MNSLKLGIIFGIVIGGFCFVKIAESRVLGSPWYARTFTLDKSTLPAGIEVVESPLSKTELERNVSDPILNPVALINKTDEPLYILGPIERGDPNMWPSELPKSHAPYFKLVSNEAFLWNYTAEFGKIGWSKTIRNTHLTNQIRVDSLPIRILPDKRGRYLSKQVNMDDRPIAPQIPEPDQITIIAFYGGGMIEIKGRITYSLNENYVPDAVKKTLERLGDKAPLACY
jgi:hypothetical protein